MARRSTLKTICISGLFAMIGGAGCAVSPYLDEHFGSAVRAIRHQQAVGADSGGPLIAPMQQEGRAARSSLDRYLRSFEQPPIAGPGIIGRIGGTAMGSGM